MENKEDYLIRKDSVERPGFKDSVRVVLGSSVYSLGWW